MLILPDDLLISIFSLLDDINKYSASLCCKRMYNLIGIIKPKCITSCIDKNQRELVLTLKIDSNESIYEPSIEHYTNLVTLDMQEIGIMSGYNLLNKLKKLPLQYLRISHAHSLELPKLKVLHLTGIRNLIIGTSCINNCPNLQYIETCLDLTCNNLVNCTIKLVTNKLEYRTKHLYLMNCIYVATEMFFNIHCNNVYELTVNNPSQKLNNYINTTITGVKLLHLIINVSTIDLDICLRYLLTYTISNLLNMVRFVIDNNNSYIIPDYSKSRVYPVYVCSKVKYHIIYTSHNYILLGIE